MGKTIILAKRPDIVLLLEKYGLLPEGKKGGVYEGVAKKWAEERVSPYDTPEYQALAERLPTGWEEQTVEEMDEMQKNLFSLIEKRKQAKLDIPDRGGPKNVKNLTQVAYLAITSLTALLIENGIGILPDSDRKEKEIAKEFSVDLVLHFIVGSNLFQQLFRSFAETVATKKQNHIVIGNLLASVALFLAVYAASDGQEDKLHSYLMEFKTNFRKGLEWGETFVSQKLAEETLQGEIAERVSLYLEQAKVALDKDDFEGFKEAFFSLLGTVNVSHDFFLEDVKEIQRFATQLGATLTLGSTDDTHISQISQAM